MIKISTSVDSQMRIRLEPLSLCSISNSYQRAHTKMDAIKYTYNQSEQRNNVGLSDTSWGGAWSVMKKEKKMDAWSQTSSNYN